MAELERFVFAYLPGANEAVPAGLLALIEQGRETLGSRFAYGRGYLQRGNRIAVDPKSLPFDGREAARMQAPANGLTLFGALRDATPDLWGRRVIENRLGRPPDSLPESVYLDHAGDNRAGALDVRTALDAVPRQPLLPGAIALEHLVDAADRIVAGEPVPAHLQIIFEGAPTLGGARPKAAITDAGRQWVAKFPQHGDGFNVPLIERSVLELARLAGIRVPDTRIVHLADQRDVMLIARFDRGSQAEGYPRTHMVSALTMLGLQEQDRSATYADLCRVIEQHGVSGEVAADRIELFRRMLFNIMVSNDDDHLRNHAFLFDAARDGWRLSPLYDVLPKPSVGTERFQAIGVGASGRLASLDNAHSQCEQFGLDKAAAAGIIEAVVTVVRAWREYFEALDAPVPARQCDIVASAFRRAGDIGIDRVRRRESS